MVERQLARWRGWATAARAAVGWHGAAVRATVAGVPVVAVVSVDAAEAARRAGAGLLPAPDPGLLACMLEAGVLPERPPAAAAGFFVPARSWRSGAADAAALSAFASGTVVLGREPSVEDLLDADLSGLGAAVVDADGFRLLVSPTVHVPPRPTRMQRLVAEELYAAVVADGAGAGRPGVRPAATT